ncbi:MAG: 16S rRNA methyltransferase [Candidatus Micrarchaeota archaeon]
MITIVFAETSLEIIPQEIQSQPIVKKSAAKREKRPAQLVLDSSLHWQAMEKLALKEKRGRPDIAHDLLKLAFDDKSEKRVFVHTINDKAISFAPDWRPPRNYNQFVGLMEELFDKKELKDKAGKTLLKVENKKLGQLLDELGSNFIVLEAKGELQQLKKFSKTLRNNNAVLIGGFPHGDFINEAALEKYEKISISTVELTAPIVLSKVLTLWELENER